MSSSMTVFLAALTSATRTAASIYPSRLRLIKPLKNSSEVEYVDTNNLSKGPVCDAIQLSMPSRCSPLPRYAWNGFSARGARYWLTLVFRICDNANFVQPFSYRITHNSLVFNKESNTLTNLLLKFITLGNDS